MAAKDPFNDLAQPFWEPIGKFVFAFGYLEFHVDNAVGTLTQLHSRQTEAIAAQIQSVPAKARLIEKLVTLLTTDEKIRFEAKKIRATISSVNTFRNKLLHGPWGGCVTEPPNEIYWTKIYVDPQSFKFKTVDIRVSEINKNEHLAWKAISEVGTLAKSAVAARAAQQP